MTPGKPVSQSKRKRYSGKENHVFFDNIQKRRVELGMTQSDLAAQISMTVSAISRMEAGVFPNDPDKLIRLALALKTDINALFSFTPYTH